MANENNDGRRGDGEQENKDGAAAGFYVFDFNEDAGPPQAETGFPAKNADAPPKGPDVPRAPPKETRPPRKAPGDPKKEAEPPSAPRETSSRAIPPRQRRNAPGGGSPGGTRVPSNYVPYTPGKKPPAGTRPPATERPPATPRETSADSPAKRPPHPPAPPPRRESDNTRQYESPAAPPGDFNVDFDFDKEYRDTRSGFSLRRERGRRTGCFGGILFAAFVISAGLILASLLWFAATDVLGFGAEDRLLQVTIPRNSTIDDIAEILYENGLIQYKFLFKIYADFSDAGEKITSGTFMLNTNFDYFALVNGMSPRGERVTTRVTIPEGFSMAQIFDRLETEGVCAAEDLWEAAANIDFEYDFLEDAPPVGDRLRLEGFLFPDTDDYYMGDNPERVLRKMLTNFDRRFNSDFRERADEMGYSIRDIVIVASMIEREAFHDVDRPLIASVIYNRLNSEEYPRLEIDATIVYAIYFSGLHDGEEWSTSLVSPFNTYNVRGLPAGPISNPGLRSIEAALEPAATGWYFYALRHDRTHHFSRTYEEHTAFVASDEYGGRPQS